MRTREIASCGFVLSMIGCAASPAEDTDQTGQDLTLPLCVAQPACLGGAGPRLGGTTSWRHFSSRLIVFSGSPNHRGRDQIITVGERLTVIGKFTYGRVDKDLKDEDVDVFVQQGCAGEWTKVGTARTTDDGDHSTVEGIEDDGGRIYFTLPRSLAVGRHRVRMVVKGDHSFAESVIDVVPPNTTYFVSDVDGTLTTEEHAEWTSLLTGSIPDARPDAARSLSALAAKGIRPIYLTARPEWLKARTREFLEANGFPPGIIHTAQGVLPELGNGSAEYKAAALSRMAAHGAKILWAFGNKAHDADAYAAANIQPLAQRIFVEHDDSHGGRRIDAYSEIVNTTLAAPEVCR